MVISETTDNNVLMPNGQTYPPVKYTHTWQYDADGYPVSLTTKQLDQQIVLSDGGDGYVPYTVLGREDTYYFFYTGGTK